MIKLSLSTFIIYTLCQFNLISISHAAVSLGGPEAVATSRAHPLVSVRGMVVSDDRIASQWGAEILREGGNAVDAAVATAFALAVTRPHYASLGGGGFLVFCPRPNASGPVPCKSIDYREEAPSGATRDLFIRNGVPKVELAQNGALASGVPGTPAGLLMALREFGSGKVSRQKILSRPIQIAKRGYTFTSHSEKAAIERWQAMNAAAKKLFGCKQSGSSELAACPPETLIRQPDLARVLENIAINGEQGFYKGKVAKLISDGIKSAGGIITPEDLATYQPKLRTPLQGSFAGHQIISMPPPSSGGGVLLELLNFTERADQAGALKLGFGSVEAIHALIHAMTLGFADRAVYYGDPGFTPVPIEALLKPEYLDRQWKTFKPLQASLPKQAGNPLLEGQHTTHFSVIDRDGNAVAVTTTVNDNFGSAFVPPGTGIVMNNEMDDFSIQPGIPNQFGLVGTEANAVAPKKRPLSSMTPTIVRDKQGNNLIVIGAAGGPRIITSVFLSLVNRLRFGMPITDAVAAPRFHHQWKPQTVLLERFGFSPDVKPALEKKGYTVSEVTSLGKIHALERFPNGRSWGMADPRGEGEAVAE